MNDADRVDQIQREWQRERPDVDVTPQGVIGRLHRLARALTVELEQVYAAHGLAEIDFDILCTLRRAGAPYARRPADLARSTMVTTGGISKRLDRLQADGLVERTKPNGGDGRATEVRLTAEGRRRIDAAFTDHMLNERRLLDQLPATDQQALERGLRAWLSHHDAT
ncbi:MarR family transcriptional regulator [Arsenicicoccus piscis]|uniref:MarR family transcriptional regulator n=1 Tax=Arsenicicoccus piscis TaxID=673954 RepID=A0ABQ6HQC2_9MICO|nr:MarR family transcriptional regulator [Arsenicicoccus piscis]MCH8629035.1 MarR family transcriptional regulator [Arsenicicoccus piscis]GMA19654.1 MarR family transcriptional regulator [Arsenicicoccus piscis]